MPVTPLVDHDVPAIQFTEKYRFVSGHRLSGAESPSMKSRLQPLRVACHHQNFSRIVSENDFFPSSIFSAPLAQRD